MRISFYLTKLYWRHRILFFFHSILAKFGEANSMAYVSAFLDSGADFVSRDQGRSIRLLQAAVDKGSVSAIVDLGKRYYGGTSLPADGLKAMSCFQKAAEMGDLIAVAFMASVYIEGKLPDVPHDVERGERMLLDCIAKGNIQAKFLWAMFVCNGILSGDPALARQYVEEALRHGYSSSCGQLGYFLLSGFGGETDEKLAHDVLSVGVALGDVISELVLWQSVLGSPTASVAQKKEAFAKLREVAKESREPQVCLMVGKELVRGSLCESKPLEAIEFVRIAKDGGSKDAVFTLASFYATGVGGLNDEAEAVRLYEEAERLGVLNARLEMSNRRFWGRGVEQDSERAVEDLSKMANEENLGCAAAMLSHLFWNVLDNAPVSDEEKERCEFSLQWLRKAVELGHAPSLFVLAQVYLYGVVVEEDKALARELATKSWEAGYEMAQVMVADSYMWFDNKEPDKAIEMLDKALQSADPNCRNYAQKVMELVQDWVRQNADYMATLKAVDDGNTDAMVRLALMHFRDLVPDSNGEVGRQLLYKAADLGNSEALLRIGFGLLYGDAFPVNVSAGLEYLHKAYDVGKTEALGIIGKYYLNSKEPDYAKAVEYFQKGMAENDSLSVYLYAKCLLEGKGVEKDVQGFYSLASKAANQGFVDAQFHLGCNYLRGIECKPDMTEAFKWLQSAAESGHVGAMTTLGYAIVTNGFSNLYEKAYHYLCEASAQNDEVAFFYLAYMYRVGLGSVPRSMYYENVNLQKAAELGYGPAMAILAKHYREGYGVEKNFSASFSWLSRAVELEDPEAMCDLAWHYYTGCAVDKDENKAIQLLLHAKELGAQNAKVFLEKILSE